MAFINVFEPPLHMSSAPGDELNLSESEQALFLSICASDTIERPPDPILIPPHPQLSTCPTERTQDGDSTQAFLRRGADMPLAIVPAPTPLPDQRISFYENCTYPVSSGFPLYLANVPVFSNTSTRLKKYHNAEVAAIQPQSTPTSASVRIPIPSNRSLSRQKLRPFENTDTFLRVPVKQLTEEERKTRRRAQVAKSARKHRNRQKEELLRLRKQVQLLQERMLAMRLRAPENYSTKDGEGSFNDAGTGKRKKIRYREQGSIKDECSQIPPDGVEAIPIEHWYHRLPVAREHRHSVIHDFVRRRKELVLHYQRSEFRSNVLPYPHTDFFLNSTMPHMEIKMIRTKRFESVRPELVADAYWQSVARFDICLPQWLKDHVLLERLDELDEDTCYGRSIAPLFYQEENQNSINLHSYVIHHRFRRETANYIMWETIQMDDLYSFERKPCRIYNNEVGSVCFKTIKNDKNGEDTVMHVVLHSAPPSDLVGEPSSRFIQAFVTLFCRRTDVFESNIIRKLDELLRQNS